MTQSTVIKKDAINAPKSEALNTVAYVDILMACPQCQNAFGPDSLNATTNVLSCKRCDTQYRTKQQKWGIQPDLRPDFKLNALEDTSDNVVALDDTESFQNKIKLFLRQWPNFYRFLAVTIGPALFTGTSSQQFINNSPDDARILSIGAGVLRSNHKPDQKIYYLDYEPYSDLDVVGDAHHLPFADNTFDSVVCETMLEHVQEPRAVLAEAHRVLKPDGRIYLMVPFLFGFHAAPNDFYRWTHKGLMHDVDTAGNSGFDTEDLIVCAGPTSALVGILIEWLAMVLSFGIQPLYRVLAMGLLLVVSPLKLFDLLLTHHPEAKRIASIFTFIGAKRPSQNQNPNQSLNQTQSTVGAEGTR